MEIDYITATLTKLRLAKAYGSSIRHNERNLESSFYGLWTLWLTYLTSRVANVIIIPQFTLWFVRGTNAIAEGDEIRPEEDNRSGPEAASANPAVPVTSLGQFGEVLADPFPCDLPPIGPVSWSDITPGQQLIFDWSASVPTLAGIDASFDAGDQSFIGVDDPLAPPNISFTESEVNPAADLTSASRDTVPLPKGEKEKIPDFVAIHVMARRMRNRNNDRFVPLEGICIVSEEAKLITECKRLPDDRGLTWDNSSKIISVLSAAITQLSDQCSHAFGKYPTLTSVMAMATCGPYWTYARVTKEQAESDEAWATIRWEGVEREGLGRIRYYTLSIDPNDLHNDEGTNAIRDYLSSFEPLPQNVMVRLQA